MKMLDNFRSNNVNAKNKRIKALHSGILQIANFVALAAAMCACSQSANVSEKPVSPDVMKREAILRGEYLVNTSACHDCHTPKVMTPQGPALDTTRLLSGHPASEGIASIPMQQDWILFSQGLTAAVGPWGVSFSANLTPDDATGTGRWTYEQFETAIRKGKSKGLERARDLLPPMPWQMYQQMTDQDLKDIFAYLQSIRPVANAVPAPIAPQDIVAVSLKN
ncbi:c-type cytochrome [Imperialibacter roseus]|uniref:C-type cytochrome n=1 Tax=Imperialibacter roseus TaxID=1324217 RepID=A0ABZ0IX72_9BACT|nr:c-type cytochrome [Imperialibacter roseus]WOK08960.1 c-type cytochrome [Imperialibacter roseus]